MAQTTAIEWTDLSWNPTHGCSKVSPGCAHCYAETLSRRYKQTLKPWTPANAAENVILKPHKLKEPLSGAKAWQGLGDAAARAGKTDGKLVFVNSMSDLFHEQIPDEYIAEVFAVMALAERHTFQVLTKRPERMRSLLGDDPYFWGMVAAVCNEATIPWSGNGWPWDDKIVPNVWLGVSIENRRFVDRANLLRETPAAVRFISAEPLLGPLIHDWDPEHHPCAEFPRFGTDRHLQKSPSPQLDLTDIDWLIVGGESGTGHREIKPAWVRDLRDATVRRHCRLCGGEGMLNNHRCQDCRGNGRATAFFFKQWGGPTSTSGGCELDGRTWDEFPQVQEVARV